MAERFFLLLIGPKKNDNNLAEYTGRCGFGSSNNTRSSNIFTGFISFWFQLSSLFNQGIRYKFIRLEAQAAETKQHKWKLEDHEVQMVEMARWKSQNGVDERKGSLSCNS